MTTFTAERSGQSTLGDRSVHRIGYGAMQLAGPHVMGPPVDRDAAVAVLRRAVELGVDHIDTSDYYWPHVTNEIIREALHPYPEDLVLVTKVGARRTPGPRRSPPASCGRRWRTTCATSASTRWTW
jgi:pyridoxine 4-dehydrogenase